MELDGHQKNQLFNFSEALELLKDNFKVCRNGWNGKDVFIKAQFPDENSKMNLPYLYIEYPDGRRCPWLASQTDLMSNDWRLFESGN